jgi:hypothetical protein
MEHDTPQAGITHLGAVADAPCRAAKVMSRLELDVARRRYSDDGDATPYPATALICRIRMRTLRTRE